MSCEWCGKPTAGRHESFCSAGCEDAFELSEQEVVFFDGPYPGDEFVGDHLERQ